MLNPSHYYDTAYRVAEQKYLFPNTWLFVGLRLELEGISHQGVALADKNLIIQCDSQGKPRAFINVCSHRHAQLCEQGLHKGAVRCPYHGWSYDREGVPVGIPQKQAFPQVVANPQNYRLQEFACEAVGQFIFVRLASSGPTLPEFLGNQYDFLLCASLGMAGVQDEFRKDVAANWKVVIENALEGYHVPAVHSNTLMQAEGMGRAENAPQFFFKDALHSHLEHAANSDWVSHFARLEAKIGQWPWRFEHYTHHFIFPNLTVTSFMGYSFHIQRFEPTSVDCTTVHSRTVGVEFNNSTLVGKKMMERIYEEGHAFTHKVFAEDGEICRKVQHGLRYAQKPAVLAEGLEDRVRHFHVAYLRSMSNGQQKV